MKMTMDESTSRNRRTLVVETLSKSPTLAYVLAKRHFGDNAAAIPAAGMVSLAIVGAAVATVWTAVDPIENYQNIQEEKKLRVRNSWINTAQFILGKAIESMQHNCTSATYMRRYLIPIFVAKSYPHYYII